MDQQMSVIDWLKTSRLLTSTMSNTMWKMGEAIYTDKVPTAACEYHGKEGKPFRFLINKDFWKSLTDYDRGFIMTHECLHALLDHGYRAFQHYGPKAGKGEFYKVNLAADLVINHSLEDIYGFDRRGLSSALEGILFMETKDQLTGKSIWPDEFMAQMEGVNPSKTTTEFILKILDSLTDENGGGGQCEGGQSGGIGGDNPLGEDIVASPDSIAKAVREAIANGTAIEELKEMGEREEFESSKQAGNGEGNLWVKVLQEKITPVTSWNEFFEWKTLSGFSDEGETESWIHDDRRYSDLTYNDPDFLIPSIVEDLAYDEAARSHVMLFLDISGSCEQFVQPFFDAFASIPMDHFEISLHTFNTRTTDLPNNIKKKDVRTSGGTRFFCIGNRVKKFEEDNGKAPDMVWVFTDGHAGDIQTVITQIGQDIMKERWVWFLDPTSLEEGSQFDQYNPLGRYKATSKPEDDCITVKNISDYMDFKPRRY